MPEIWRIIDTRVTNEQIRLSLFGMIHLSICESINTILAKIILLKSYYIPNRSLNMI